MRILILIVLALLSGCASGHNYGGAGTLLLGILLPDPNELTAEDREIMEREQAEADAAERAHSQGAKPAPGQSKS